MCPICSREDFVNEELLGSAHEKLSYWTLTNRGIAWAIDDIGCILGYNGKEYNGELAQTFGRAIRLR